MDFGQVPNVCATVNLLPTIVVVNSEGTLAGSTVWRLPVPSNSIFIVLETLKDWSLHSTPLLVPSDRKTAPTLPSGTTIISPVGFACNNLYWSNVPLNPKSVLINTSVPESTADICCPPSMPLKFKFSADLP